MRGQKAVFGLARTAILTSYLKPKLSKTEIISNMTAHHKQIKALLPIKKGNLEMNLQIH